jgi:hypothetical protein
MKNGNLTVYLRQQPNVNRVQLVCLCDLRLLITLRH